MEKEAEKFLQAEETAFKLAETLKELHNEATSYQTATKELEIVRQRLLNLIEATEKVASGSHEVIVTLKQIGGPEILNRIGKVEEKQNQGLAKQLMGLKRLKNLVIVTLFCSILGLIIGIIALLKLI